MTRGPLGPRHHEVKRLRALLRDREVRAGESVFVLEGPRAVAGALDRGAPLEAVYVAADDRRGFADLIEHAQRSGVPVIPLADGVVERVSTTRTPQPLLATAPLIERSMSDVGGAGMTLVTIDVGDPGNLGTIIRSAEASGADGVIVTGTNSVDPHHPKVVRSTAGAIFGVPVVEREEALATLEELGRAGRRRLATRARDGEPYDRADLGGSCALVFGNETRGIPAAVDAQLDGAVTVPIAGSSESLNVAMAATVLCFEAARQRRVSSVAR